MTGRPQAGSAFEPKHAETYVLLHGLREALLRDLTAVLPVEAAIAAVLGPGPDGPEAGTGTDTVG